MENIICSHLTDYDIEPIELAAIQALPNTPFVAAPQDRCQAWCSTSSFLRGRQLVDRHYPLPILSVVAFHQHSGFHTEVLTTHLPPVRHGFMHLLAGIL